MARIRKPAVAATPTPVIAPVVLPGPEQRGRKALGKQISVRFASEVRASLNEIVEAMGIELGTLVRVIVTENHEPYLQRVRARRAAQKATG